MINRIKNRLDSHGREIFSKSLLTFILKILGSGLAFLLQFVIARQLGADGSGLYFLALNILVLLATVTRLGMDNSVTRFVAAHASDNDWEKVKGVTRLSLLLACGLSLLASLVFYFLAMPLVKLLDKPELLQVLQWMLLLTTPLALMTLFARAIQGLKLARQTMLMQSVLVPLVACVLTYSLAPRYGIMGAVIAYAAGLVFTLLYGMQVWSRAMRPFRQVSARFDRQLLLKSSFPLMGAIILQQITQSLPLLALGYWASSADVGIFGAAQRTATLVSLVLIAANIIVAPKLSELYQQNNMAALGRVARQGAMLMTAMASPVLLLCLLVPEWIMGLFGPEFRSGWLLLVIMAVGQLVNVLTGSVGFLLIMTGNEKSFFSANLLSAALSVTLVLLLVPVYGALGAAFAVAVPVAVVNLVRVRFIWKQMGIMTLPIPWKSKKTSHN